MKLLFQGKSSIIMGTERVLRKGNRYEKDHVRLQPENDYMDPIIAQDVTIVGKVKGVFRFLS